SGKGPQGQSIVLNWFETPDTPDHGGSSWDAEIPPTAWDVRRRPESVDIHPVFDHAQPSRVMYDPPSEHFRERLGDGDDEVGGPTGQLVDQVVNHPLREVASVLCVYDHWYTSQPRRPTSLEPHSRMGMNNVWGDSPEHPDELPRVDQRKLGHRG